MSSACTLCIVSTHYTHAGSLTGSLEHKIIILYYMQPIRDSHAPYLCCTYLSTKKIPRLQWRRHLMRGIVLCAVARNDHI